MSIFVPVLVEKEYIGWVDVFGETRVTVDGETLRHVDFHSPNNGFDWGDTGLGAADLALSILADYFGEWWVSGNYIRGMSKDSWVPKCWEYHQAFKQLFCSHWKKQMGTPWHLSTFEISMFLILSGYNMMLIIEIDTDTQP